MVRDRMIEKESTDNLMDGMVVARLDSHGHTFEVIVEADYASEGRKDDWKDITEHMPSEEIFSDARKGERPSQGDMKEAFGDTDTKGIAIKILKKGQVQLTTEQRRQMQEEKRKQIVAAIVREAMNPQTKTPHPPQRIETAMAEAGVHIDPIRSAASQVKDIVEALRPFIPISFEKARLAVKLQAVDYGKCYGDIKALGKISQEEWLNDGSWVGVVELPAGLQEELISKLNKKTKGNIETKMLK